LVFIYHWKKSQQTLSQWVKAISIYPQTLQNVRVRSKPAIKEIPGLIEIIERTEAQLHNQGRVLVRYSGTEPICRVMLEGPDKEILQQFSAQICNVIKREIG
jgi:phosphoglucosamine mutase